MLDATTYAPIPLKTAQLESSEKHLHSFNISRVFMRNAASPAVSYVVSG